MSGCLLLPVNSPASHFSSSVCLCLHLCVYMIDSPRRVCSCLMSIDRYMRHESLDR